MSHEVQRSRGAAPNWLRRAASRAKEGAQLVLGGPRVGSVITEIVPDVTAHEVLAANDHAAIIRVERPGMAPQVVKVAYSDVAASLLQNEAAALDELHERSALGDWRTLVPTRHGAGATDEVHWLSQSFLGGQEIAGSDLTDCEIVERSMRALRPLHDATMTSLMADDGVLDDLISGPIAAIAETFPDLEAELTVLNAECRQRLASLELHVCRQHGDFGPGSVLWDAAAGEDGDIVGIVDWQLVMRRLPPEVDCMQFALSLLARREQSPFGEAATAVLAEGASTAQAETARSVVEAGPNGFDVRTAVALTWLQHVAFGLATNPALSDDAAWLDATLRQVVQSLNRSSDPS